MTLHLHFLDARASLTPLRAWISDALLQTHAKAAQLLPLQPLDVVIQAGQQVVPEKGLLGYAPRPGLIHLTIDPGHPALLANAQSSLERMFAHELHHAARWDGPGYGATLGEALVSEGLAGHFAQELLGGDPEPWETLDILSMSETIALALQMWSRDDHDHGAWFFGTEALPRWVGYSLGYQMVGRYVRQGERRTASGMVALEAEALRNMLAEMLALAQGRDR